MISASCTPANSVVPICSAVVWFHQNYLGSFYKLLLFQRFWFNSSAHGLGYWDFSSAPQIILMCSQGGSVKIKVPVPTARGFDSLSLGLWHESWSLTFLRDFKVKPDLGATVPATILYFQLPVFCFPGVPEANQGLVTNADSWVSSLSQFLTQMLEAAGLTGVPGDSYQGIVGNTL